MLIIHTAAEGCVYPPLSWREGNICPHFPDEQNKAVCREEFCRSGLEISSGCTSKVSFYHFPLEDGDVTEQTIPECLLGWSGLHTAWCLPPQECPAERGASHPGG